MCLLHENSYQLAKLFFLEGTYLTLAPRGSKLRVQEIALASKYQVNIGAGKIW